MPVSSSANFPEPKIVYASLPASRATQSHQQAAEPGTGRHNHAGMAAIRRQTHVLTQLEQLLHRPKNK